MEKRGMAATREEQDRERSQLEALWIREAARWDGTGGAFGEAMLAAIRLRRGEQVLDVGCGTGATTLAAGAQVGPAGRAMGVDISAPIIELARRRGSGVANVEFIEGDAQDHPFGDGRFDAVISRFGTMFFADPAAAFANLQRALRPKGRLAIVCWADPRTAEWTAVAGRVALEHFGRPPDLGAPGAPGPYAFADGDHLRNVLASAGFAAVKVEAIVRTMRMGDDLADVVGFVTSLEQTKQLFAGEPAERVSAVVDALRTGFAPFVGPEGVVMRGTAWLATASR
jgi:SAM-dependent methyltransferase